MYCEGYFSLSQTFFQSAVKYWLLQNWTGIFLKLAEGINAWD